MIRRFIPAAAAATGLVATLLVVAPTASAGTGSACTNLNYTPRTVVLGLSETTKTFTVTASGCTPEAWTIDFGSGFVLDQDLSQVTFTSADLPNSEAGVKYDAWVTATDDADVTAGHQMNGSFVIKRRTEWRSFNASPEPVSKGKPIKITGALKVANWESRKYTAQKGSRVSVQFKKAGTSSYVTVKTVTTSSTYGTVSTSVNATYDGRWRLVYGGSGTRGPATSLSDYVDVR